MYLEMLTKKILVFIILVFTFTPLNASVTTETAVDYPSGILPGKAKACVFFNHYKLYNNILEFKFEIYGEYLKPVSFKNKHSGDVFSLADGSLFTVAIKNGAAITSSDFLLIKKPQIEKILSEDKSVRLADRFFGKRIIAPLISKDGKVAIDWVLTLRDGGNYVRQEIIVTAVNDDVDISEIQMLDFFAQGGEVAGVLAGCPVVSGDIFLGYENPNAWVKIFDPAEGENLALNREVCCSSEVTETVGSSENKTGLAKKAVNGDLGTKNYWRPEKLPAHIIIDLGEEVSIDKIKLHMAYNFNLTFYWFREWVYEYVIETSADGENWEKIAVKSDNKIATFEPDEISFAPTRSRFVKVTLLKYNMDGSNHGGLRQIEIFNSKADKKRLAKLSANERQPRINAILNRNQILPAKSVIKQSAVFGVAPEGQMRRAFLYYLERERAHPYRGFLHYNSFYDIVLKKESDCVQRIQQIGDEITGKHNTVLDSYAFDDGWDNPGTLWQFHDGFRDGFKNMKAEAGKYDSALGVWMSPSGGYGKERVKYAKSKGYKVNDRGICMSDEKYYLAFLNCCEKMMTDYNVNYFKFDRLGEGLHTFGGTAEYTEDVEATLRLMKDMRKIKPDVFINLTVGAWASPYLLFYCDSIWRDGGDSDFFGQGSKREQWITYRDCQTYRNIVKRSPLFPITSLMTCGIINGQLYHVKDMPKSGDDFVHETRSFFANGTNCQELYITPDRMSELDWKAVAEGAKFARENERILADSHWIGGDPGKGQVYGWASWSKNEGIIALRNPCSKNKVIAIDIGKAFELPENAAQKYSLKSPWHEGRAKSLLLSAGKDHTFTLSGFEVLVLKACAAK